MQRSLLKGVAVSAHELLVRRSVTIPTPLGFRFVLSPGDPKSLKMASGFYEREDVALFRRLHLQDGWVLDIGANIGFFSLLFAKTWPDCKVCAIEPNAYAVGRLKENLSVNAGLSRRIQLEQCALGASADWVDLVAYPGARGHAWGRIGIEPKPEMLKQRVFQRRLDDVVPKEHNVLLLKIDVEGYELDVLKGAMGIIERRQPIIVLECSLSFLIEKPGAYQELLSIARANGYRIMVADRGKRLVPYEWPFARVFNMWWLPQRHHTASLSAAD